MRFGNSVEAWLPCNWYLANSSPLLPWFSSHIYQDHTAVPLRVLSLCTLSRLPIDWISDRIFKSPKRDMFNEKDIFDLPRSSEMHNGSINQEKAGHFPDRMNEFNLTVDSLRVSFQFSQLVPRMSFPEAGTRRSWDKISAILRSKNL